MKKNTVIIFLLFLVMDGIPSRTKENYEKEEKVINGKRFIIPKHNLYGCQKYMIPKLDNAPVHHTFFSPEALEAFYKEKNIDPKTLNHNLDNQEKKEERGERKHDDSSSFLVEEKTESMMEEEIQEVKGRPRPPLREKGFTHFIHLPLQEYVRDLYENQVVPRIQEEDRDLLVPLTSLHMTVMVFRLRSLDDLPLWSQVLQSARSVKKSKLNLRGAQTFSVKQNYGSVLYMPVKGADDIIDRVVSKAIELNLVKQSDLSFIKFDKIAGIYRAQAHITLLKTKGKDLIDFSNYLKTFKNLNAGKVTANQIRLSMIGSHDGEDYFNEDIVKL